MFFVSSEVSSLHHEDLFTSTCPSDFQVQLRCRAELWCRLLSNKVDTSVILIYSPTEAEFMFPLDWQHNSIAEGNFTVEDDRAEVVRLGEMAVESKIQNLQEKGPLSHYRFYAALRPQLLNQARKDREVDAVVNQCRKMIKRHLVQ